MDNVASISVPAPGQVPADTDETMSDEEALRNHRHAMERAKARIFEEAAAKAAAIDRDMAELERIAAEYNLTVTLPDAGPKDGEADNGRMSVAELIAAYKSNPESPYRALRFKTRENYDSLLRRIERDVGRESVAVFDEVRLRHQHADWSAEGRLAMAKSLMTAMRILATFGADSLKSKACRGLKHTLADMEFPSAPPRVGQLTEKHVRDIRETAHKMGYPSIALAQAIQFDTGLRQKDVIGEWVPVEELGAPSEFIHGNSKWMRGLRWSAVDSNLLLRHWTGRGAQRELTFDLHNAKMVLREFDRLGRDRPTTREPMIVYEGTGKPYLGHQFRRIWRLVANAAGVPKTVENRDSSGGAKGELAEQTEQELAR
jgi:hypothetical protein